MHTFTAPDGTQLAYHVIGPDTPDPVICLPGGMQASAYLGDLGGLAAHRQLVLLDLRGTGESAQPLDPDSYRCDRQVPDVEALRVELGLDRIDLLGHSAGASLAIQYAAEHPTRIRTLALITPSTRAVGIDVTLETRRRMLDLRKDEPWYPAAAAAFDNITAGRAEPADWAALAPVGYARWDATTQAHHAAQPDAAALQIFNSPASFDPPTTRTALTKLDAPVLLLTGDLDGTTDPTAATEFATLFPRVDLVIQPTTSHFPWLDNPTAFVPTVTAFWTTHR